MTPKPPAELAEQNAYELGLERGCEDAMTREDFLTKRLAERGTELERLRDALRIIRGDECHNFTTGLGSCYQNGRMEDAEYGADRCCGACIADRALTER